jgi:glutathione S-transferase
LLRPARLDSFGPSVSNPSGLKQKWIAGVARIILYELGGANGERYSQFAWRTRMALAHKGLEFDTVPVRVSDKAAIAFSEQDKVPILKDGEHVVFDSWKIAEYLESTYPDRPSLFGGEVGYGLTRFINTLTDRQWIGKLVPSMMLDVLGIVDAEDAAHLRKLERLFKKSMEEMATLREQSLADFRRALDPLRVTLRWQPFLSGAAPAYADYIVFSVFQWARIVSKTEVLETADALVAWRERMLDLFDGFARKEKPR